MVSQQDQGAAIAFAASKYQVPLETLVGVYGLETSYGTNITTSPTGAVGAFQFEPATAAQYNYPLTNAPSKTQFYQQADAAAHLLSDLHKQFGDWSTAAAAYNAGPANVAAGRGYAAGIPGAFKNAPKGLMDAVLGQVGKSKLAQGLLGGGQNSPPGTTVTGNLNPLSGIDAIGNFFSDLTDPHVWLRVIEVVGAVALIVFGVAELAGAGQAASPIHRVRSKA